MGLGPAVDSTGRRGTGPQGMLPWETDRQTDRQTLPGALSAALQEIPRAIKIKLTMAFDLV